MHRHANIYKLKKLSLIDYSWELWSVLNGEDLRIDAISHEFSHNNIAQLTTEWPEGPRKFYNYLFLHPSRLCEIVPPYSIEKFGTFVESVFYVGKGTDLRSLDHFKEARVNHPFRAIHKVKLHVFIPVPAT